MKSLHKITILYSALKQMHLHLNQSVFSLPRRLSFLTCHGFDMMQYSLNVNTTVCCEYDIQMAAILQMHRYIIRVYNI